MQLRRPFPFLIFLAPIVLGSTLGCAPRMRYSGGSAARATMYQEAERRVYETSPARVMDTVRAELFDRGLVAVSSTPHSVATDWVVTQQNETRTQRKRLTVLVHPPSDGSAGVQVEATRKVITETKDEEGVEERHSTERAEDFEWAVFERLDPHAAAVARSRASRAEARAREAAYKSYERRYTAYCEKKSHRPRAYDRCRAKMKRRLARYR